MYIHKATIFSTLLLPLASAICYGEVPSASNKQLGLDSTWDSAKMLQGELSAGQVRGVCVTDNANGLHWYFSIRNVGTTGQTVPKEKINKYLRTEIEGCGNGGGFSQHDWIQYNSDANPGLCTDVKYINRIEPPARIPTRRGAAIARRDIVFAELSTLAALRPEQLAYHDGE